MTRVAVLTPPGTAAVATVEVRGPGVWDAARQLFHPAKGELPESPPLHRFWYGRLGDGGDDVILAVRQVEPEPVLEIQCHGGRRVVRWVAEQFAGSVEEKPRDGHPWALLERARTTHTAAILLDQCHGAFDRAVADILSALDANDLDTARRRLGALASFSSIGRHLVAPWTVVVAGAPNVGKSSLVNALAGYQRAVVSDVPGTTRDVVTTPVAFDGWPVELADTAGLRRAAESLEAEGIDSARRFLSSADLIVWVLDGSAPAPVPPDPSSVPTLAVVNKTDLPPGWAIDPSDYPVRVSARTGAGVPELVPEIVRRLTAGADPPPGAAVPYTPALADAIAAAGTALHDGNVADARRLLASCLTPPG